MRRSIQEYMRCTRLDLQECIKQNVAEIGSTLMAKTRLGGLMTPVHKNRVTRELRRYIHTICERGSGRERPEPIGTGDKSSQWGITEAIRREIRYGVEWVTESVVGRDAPAVIVGK